MSQSSSSESKIAARGKFKILDRSRIFASTQLQPFSASGLTPSLIQSYQGPRIEKYGLQLLGAWSAVRFGDPFSSQFKLVANLRL